MYNIVQMTIKYLDYPVSVKLSVDHQAQLTFPSVTVCNMSPIKNSAWTASAEPVKRKRKRRRKRSIGGAFLPITYYKS